MLEILLIIWIGRTFYNFSKKNKISVGLWTTLGVLSYILGEFVGIIVLAATNPYDLENIGMVYLYGLPGAALFTFGCYYLMKSVASGQQASAPNDVLDDEL